MKKAIIIWLIFVVATSYSLCYLRFLRQKEEEAIIHLIKKEKKDFQHEGEEANSEVLFIIIFTIILGIIIFFGINYIFRYYDKKTKNILTTAYTAEIRINFKKATTSLVEKPLKYLIYQNNTKPEALFKNAIQNIVTAGFNFLLFSFLRSFKVSKIRIKKIIKESFCDVVHNRLIKEYIDTIYGIYQNKFLEDFQQFNKNIDHFCECLKKRKVSNKKIENIKELLKVKIKQRKKLKNNYLILVLLFAISILLFASEKDSFYEYLKDFTSRKYSFGKIMNALGDHRRIYSLKKELLKYSGYADNLLEVEKALDYALNKQSIYIMWMFAARAYFSQNETFFSFVIQMIFEAIRDFVFGKAASILFRADSTLKSIKENPLVDAFMNNKNADNQILNSLMM